MPDLSDYTLEQYIHDLQQIVQRYPEAEKFPVEKWMPTSGRHTAPKAGISYRRLGTGAPAFWHESDGLAKRGEPVIRI